MKTLRIMMLAMVLMMASQAAWAGSAVGFTAMDLTFDTQFGSDYEESYGSLTGLKVCRVYVLKSAIYVFVKNQEDECDSTYEYKISYSGDFKEQFYDFGKTSIVEGNPVMFTTCSQVYENDNEYSCTGFSLMSK